MVCRFHICALRAASILSYDAIYGLTLTARDAWLERRVFIMLDKYIT